MIRMFWSPHHFNVEMRTNWHAVNDMHTPLAERLATFEGQCRHINVTSAINRHLQQVLEDICSHIVSSIHCHAQNDIICENAKVAAGLEFCTLCWHRIASLCIGLL